MGLFGEGFRQGRDQARAARGASPLPGRPRDAGQDRRGPPSWDEPPAPYAAAGIDAGQDAATFAELQAALHQRDGELAENRRLLAEMADYAEKMEARVVELVAQAEPMAKAIEQMEAYLAELIAGAELMAKVLRLPGVKTFLMNKFHPDKYPDADDRQRALLTEATKTITVAYALADQLQTQSSE